MDLTIEGWAEFVAIVEAGSVSAAARTLAAPRASVSRRLGALEETLGVRLIHRSTRTHTLTEEGEVFYHRARAILAEVEGVLRRTRVDEITGILRVSAPPLVGSMQDLFLDFCDRYPALSLELHQSSRFVDLRSERFDVALRAGASHRDDDLISKLVVRDELVVVANPDYLERAGGGPAKAMDLIEHACIVGFGGGERPVTHWPLHKGGEVAVRLGFACMDIRMQMHVTLHGRGIGLLPRILCQPFIDSGKLVHLFEQEVGQYNSLRLVYPERAHMPARVRAFIDYAVKWFAEHPVASLESTPSC